MGHGYSHHNQQSIQHRSSQLIHQADISNDVKEISNFYDLQEFPPEIALAILSNLNATDLCLASCVWKDLAEDERLWRSLCLSKWRYTTIYNRIFHHNHPTTLKQKPVFKHLYLLLDEATLIFSFRPHHGIKYLIDHDIVADDAVELAKFINETAVLSNRSIQIFFQDRQDVLDEFLKLQDFSGVSICDSLRHFFKKVYPPEQSGRYLGTLVDKFSMKYGENNPQCEWTKENIAVICYSLLLLSVDLYSPHVKNKMSKREFIRNNRQVIANANAETLGDFYDDVYLNGHIVPADNCKQIKSQKQRFPFYRPYGAIFEFKPMELRLMCPC